MLDYTTKGVDDIDLFPYVLNETKENPYFLAIQQLDKLEMFNLMFDGIDLTKEYVSNILVLIKLKLITDKLSKLGLETKSVNSIDEKLFNLVNNLSSEDKLKLLKDLESK